MEKNFLEIFLNDLKNYCKANPDTINQTITLEFEGGDGDHCEDIYYPNCFDAFFEMYDIYNDNILFKIVDSLIDFEYRWENGGLGEIFITPIKKENEIYILVKIRAQERVVDYIPNNETKEF